MVLYILTNTLFNQQDIACLVLALVSWCLVTGSSLGGTERGGEKMFCAFYCRTLVLFPVKLKVESVFVYCRRLQIEEMEARIAMMPLIQAEHDRR